MDWLPLIASIKQDMRQLVKDLERLEKALDEYHPRRPTNVIDRYVEITDMDERF